MKTSFTIPDQLAKLVDEKCKALGITKTELFVDAIWFFLLNARH